jgi:hypothetical protein
LAQELPQGGIVFLGVATLGKRHCHVNLNRFHLGVDTALDIIAAKLAVALLLEPVEINAVPFRDIDLQAPNLMIVVAKIDGVVALGAIKFICPAGV